MLRNQSNDAVTRVNDTGFPMLIKCRFGKFTPVIIVTVLYSRGIGTNNHRSSILEYMNKEFVAMVSN